MSDAIEALMQRIRGGGDDDVREAALALGLWLERERARPADDAEYGRALDALTAYLRETAQPPVSAVWALSKASDPRSVPAFVELLDRFAPDPARQDVAEQAVYGLIPAASNSAQWNAALDALRRAAQTGTGEAAAAAADYLRRFA